MNERILILAAKWIVETELSLSSLDDCRRAVERCRGDYLKLENQSWVSELIADCDAWLDAAKRYDEQTTTAGTGTDEPITSPTERAKAVARELAKRGVHATAHAFSLQLSPWTEPYGISAHGRYKMGPCAIADQIQALETARTTEKAQ